MQIIHKVPVEATNINGGLRQEILFTMSHELFRIRINFESYRHQSYAILEHYSQCGWMTLTKENPYNWLTFSYDLEKDIEKQQNIFEIIFKSLTEYAREISQILKFKRKH